MTRALAPRARAEFWATVLGCLLVIAALIIIWMARLSIPYDLYVSELGAPDLPTAHWFELALLLIVAGGSLVAYAARGIRSRVRVFSAWTPSISLWIGCACFLGASQVTCTAGCPVPYGVTFTWQDFTHTSLAVIAFGAACWAMLQVALARGYRTIAVVSLATGIGVAAIAGAGGILSLLQFEADFGSRLELVATTLAIGWLVALGGVLAAALVVRGREETTVRAAIGRGQRPRVGRMRSSTWSARRTSR